MACCHMVPSRFPDQWWLISNWTNWNLKRNTNILFNLIYSKWLRAKCRQDCSNSSEIASFMWQTWGPPGSCRPQMGPMLGPWTLLSGLCIRGASICVPLSHSIEAIVNKGSGVSFHHIKSPVQKNHFQHRWTNYLTLSVYPRSVCGVISIVILVLLGCAIHICISRLGPR